VPHVKADRHPQLGLVLHCGGSGSHTAERFGGGSGSVWQNWTSSVQNALPHANVPGGGAQLVPPTSTPAWLALQALV
jgi:hypothetical protein